MSHWLFFESLHLFPHICKIFVSHAGVMIVLCLASTAGQGHDGSCCIQLHHEASSHWCSDPGGNRHRTHPVLPLQHHEWSCPDGGQVCIYDLHNPRLKDLIFTCVMPVTQDQKLMWLYAFPQANLVLCWHFKDSSCTPLCSLYCLWIPAVRVCH